jgi:hypothetical protein
VDHGPHLALNASAMFHGPADDGKRRGDWTFCLPFKRRGSGGGNGIRFSLARGAGG